MTPEDLMLLVEEIRLGRGEDSTLELKRAWWRFDVEAQRHEFIRDICGMANAVAGDVEPRRIVIGVNEKGHVYNAPLPRDEAELQEVLLRITPHPNVSFQVLPVDGLVVTVVTVAPPFDRPYVANYDSKNWVHVRMGSRVCTATRGHLDRYYSERQAVARVPDLVFEVGRLAFVEGDHLQDDAAEPVEDATAEEWGTTFGTLSMPVFGSHQEYLNSLDEELAWIGRAEEDGPSLTREDQEKLEEYEKKVRDHRDAVEDPSRFEAWYLQEHGMRGGSWFQFRIVNVGTAVATTVKARIDLPDGLVALERGWRTTFCGPSRPHRPLLERDLEEIRQWEASTKAGLAALGISTGLHRALQTQNLLGAISGFHLDVPNLALINWTPAHVGPPFGLAAAALARRHARVDVEPGLVDLEVAEILHDHAWAPADRVALVAMPGVRAGIHLVAVDVFCRESKGYVRRHLRLSLGADGAESGAD